MDQYAFFEYIRQLHLFVESQDKKLNQLEALVQTLSHELNELKNKPSIQVERIEYKFDQLKVETLEGTLNIGLNPNDLNSIEDFAVDNVKPVDPTYCQAPAYPIESKIRIEEAILKDIDISVNNIIQQYEQDKQTKIDETYIAFIKDDIRKQLPNRIQYYLNQIQAKQRNQEQAFNFEIQVIDLIKTDIQNGIYVFLDNLPTEVKGQMKK